MKIKPINTWANYCYAYYDLEDNLLYIGKTTKNPLVRYLEHLNNDKEREMMKKVRYIGYKLFKDESEMDRCESYCIKHFQPKYNQLYSEKLSNRYNGFISQQSFRVLPISDFVHHFENPKTILEGLEFPDITDVDYQDKEVQFSIESGSAELLAKTILRKNVSQLIESYKTKNDELDALRKKVAEKEKEVNELHNKALEANLKLLKKEKHINSIKYINVFNRFLCGLEELNCMEKFILTNEVGMILNIMCFGDDADYSNLAITLNYPFLQRVLKEFYKAVDSGSLGCVGIDKAEVEAYTKEIYGIVFWHEPDIPSINKLIGGSYFNY